MSITVTTDIFCDADGCLWWIDGVVASGIRKRDARVAARQSGWRCDSTGDFCPDHTGDGYTPPPPRPLPAGFSIIKVEDVPATKETT